MLSLSRNLLAFVFAAVMTTGLFYIMQSMISSEPQRSDMLQDINVIEFIPYKPGEDLPEEKPPELPQQPKLLAPPQTPALQTITPAAPNAASPEMQKFKMDLPLQMSGVPFIGTTAPVAELGEAIPLVRIPPQYPSAAKRRNLSGNVVVEFTINEQGLVESPIIVQANPPGIFDNSALQAILRWKFKPKIENGQPVKRRATQELVFEPVK